MRHKQQRLLEQNIQHLEAYIKEHKLDITPELMILSITEADPDWQNFKNSKWLIKNLLNKNFLWEDIKSGKQSKAFDTLSRFINIRKQWPEHQLKDINKYIGLSGIAEVIRPFEITKSMGELKREEKAKVYSETIVVYDKNDYLVVIPKTQEASCFWGRNTEWCTASTKSDNYFDHYNPKGPLMICITPDNKKYQFHKNSEPMNENDKPINNITDPVLVELALLTGQIDSIKYIDYTNPLHAKLSIQSYSSAWSSMQKISPDIENYFEICKKAIDKNWNTLKFIPPGMEGYVELCKLAVQKNGDALKFISPDTEDYFEICKIALKQIGYAIKGVPFNKFETEDYLELCKIALQTHGEFLEFIPNTIPNYQELCFMAVKSSPHAIAYIDRENPDYYELWRTAIEYNNSFHYNILEYIPQNYEHFIELSKLIIKQDPLIIHTLSPFDPSYRDLLNYAVEHDTSGHIIDIIPNEELTLDMYKIMVKHNGQILKFIDSSDPDYAKFCLQAVHNDGLSIQHVDKKKVNNFDELCEIAVHQNAKAIKYVPIKTKKYPELCKIAVSKNPRTIQHISTYAISNEESRQYSSFYQDLLKLAIKEDAHIIQSVNLKNPDYYELWKIAILTDGSTLAHFPISFVDPELKEEYLKACRIAIENDPMNIRYVYKKLPEYREYARMALDLDVQAIEYIPDAFVENYNKIKQQADVIQKQNKSLTYEAPDWFIEKEHESIGLVFDSLPSIKKDISYQKMIDI